MSERLLGFPSALTKINQNHFLRILRDYMKKESLFIFTQNALPSKWEPVEAERMRVVSRHYGESFLLIGEFKALGDGVVESHRFVERHVGPAIVVSLVNTPT